MLKTTVVALSALMSAGTIPALAATQLQPGEWQTTETGSENGKPVPPRVEKECMTPEEARDATSLVNEMKKEMTDQGAQCETADVRQSGDTVTYNLKCKAEQKLVFEITGTYTLVSATRYTGKMKSEIIFAGQKMTSDKSVEAVHVGACRPGAGKTK